MSYNGIKVAHIVATDLNGCIGKDGKMPWHIPADLKRFRELTTGGVVIMGRKTFESLGCKPLPNRMNVITTRDYARSAAQGVVDGAYMWTSLSVEDSLEFATSFASKKGLGQVWVIGGAEIYAQTMPYVDVIEQTIVILATVDGDTWYNFDEDNFSKQTMSPYLKDKKSSHSYRYLTWERKADG